jgi:hypothetical protein
MLKFVNTKGEEIKVLPTVGGVWQAPPPLGTVVEFFGIGTFKVVGVRLLVEYVRSGEPHYELTDTTITLSAKKGG